MDFIPQQTPTEVMEVPPQTLAQEIERVSKTFDLYRRRARFHIWSSALLWLGITIPVLTSFLLFALGWWGGNDIRVTGFFIWLTVVAAICVTTLILPLKQLGQPMAIAQKIGDSMPAHRSAIVSADQFIGSDSTAHFSSYMLQQHLAHTFGILSGAHPGSVIPLRRLLAPAILFVLAVISTIFFSATHQSIIVAGIHSLLTDQELPESAFIHERLNPVVGDLTLRLKYPDYLGKKDRVLNSFSGGLEAPMGTTVVLEASPLETDAISGTIDLSNGSSQPLGFLSDGRVAGKFVVDDIEWFSLSLGDERQLIRGPRRSVHVETDRRPTIRLLRPAKALEVDADGDVRVEFEAHDDHGISRVDLIVRSARDINVQKTIAHAAPKITHLRSDYQWRVSSVKLEDVHEVELLVRVYDDDTIGGPKFSNSSAVPVKIMTPKSRQQLLILKQGQILDAMVDLLASRISSPVPVGKDNNAEIRERYLKLRGETEDVTTAIVHLLRRFDEEQHVAPMLRDTWRQIREDLTNQLLFEGRLNAPPMAPHKKRAGVNSVSIRLLEKSIAQVDDLILDLQFYTMNESGKLLEQQREELSDLLKLYKKRRSERSRRNILASLRRMQRTARYLAEKIGKVRGQVSSAAVSTSMEDTVNLNGYFRQIEEAIAGGDMDKALQVAQKLEHTVAQLMASLESGHLTFKNERFGKHNKFVDSLLEKLTRVEGSQLQLRRKTIGIQRQYKEKVLNMMRGEIDDIVKAQIRWVKRIRAAIDRIRDPELTTDSKTADALRDLTLRMNEVLKQGDLDRSLEIAEEIKTRIQLSKSSAISNKTFGQLDAIEKMATRIIEHIQESFPNPNRIFNDRDKRLIRTFSFNQRRLAVTARKIAAWVREQKNDLQFISSQTLQTLKVVTQHMKAGTNSLEKRDLNDAAKRQTLALDALTTLRQNLKKSGNTVLLETVVSDESRQVFIPGPREYQVPKKHREDILNAMKANLPERYREAIRKYYETLVQ